MHPQGGGSERYLEHIAAHLAAEGHRVILRTSRPPGSPARQYRDGYTVSRGGGRFTVYPRALAAIIGGRLGIGPLAGFGTPEVVVDTQNGVPFFARLVAGCPVVVLVHHVHREQWPVAGPLVARIGWWIESRLAPRVHAGCQYVTVSVPSARELADLGVDPGCIAVVRNGLDPLPSGSGHRPPDRSDPTSRLVVLSRLVPHKHIEDALDTLAALRPRFPGLVLDVIGDGWWADRLHARADAAGLRDGREVFFHGHVDELAKHRILATAAVHLMPSRKEGWGLAVSEAAQHGVPTIGYRHSGGLRDSVDDGVTGLLVGDPAEMTRATERLLLEPGLRQSMGRAARDRARSLSWDATGRAMDQVLRAVRAGRRISGVVTDPVSELPGASAGPR